MAIKKLTALILGPSYGAGPVHSKPPVARIPTPRLPTKEIGGITTTQSSSKNKPLKKSKETFINPKDKFKKNPF